MKKLLTFKEFILNESPIAYNGDYKGNRTVFGDISKTVLDKYYKEITLIKAKNLKLDDVKVFIIDTETKAVIGRFEDNTFIVLGELYPSKYKDINKFGYKNVLQTSEVGVKKEYRGAGIGTSLYLSLINAGYTLISDYNQFDGARNLWRGLQGYKIKLDVFDEVEDEITKKHKIIHTSIDNLDKEWSKFPSQNGDRYLFIAFK